MFACATEAANRSYKKISSYAVDSGVILVIVVVQQLCVDELGKNRWLSLG